MSTDPLLITGDFNIHVNLQCNNNSLRFVDLLQSMGLQHVDFPTHVSGNTLDLVIARDTDFVLGSSPKPDRYLSDHTTILFELITSKPSLSRKTVSYRSIKSVNIEELTKDLITSKLCLDTPTQLDSLVSCYNNTISTLLDRHAPMKTRTVAVRPMVPWYNEKIRLAKKERRKAERKWRRTKTPTYFNLFKTLKNRVTYLMNKARCSFFSDFVGKNSDDQGKLFRAIKKLLVQKDVLFSPGYDKTVLVNDLGNFFVQNISRISS